MSSFKKQGLAKFEFASTDLVGYSYSLSGYSYRHGRNAQSALATELIRTTPRFSAMGRKGGGKKAFLKGVVAKPEADEVSAAATIDQGQGGPTSAETQTDAKRSDTDNGSASSSTAHLPEVTSTAQDLESESRGQLTQRHKKVTSPCAAA